MSLHLKRIQSSTKFNTWGNFIKRFSWNYHFMVQNRGFITWRSTGCAPLLRDSQCTGKRCCAIRLINVSIKWMECKKNPARTSVFKRGETMNSDSILPEEDFWFLLKLSFNSDSYMSKHKWTLDNIQRYKWLRNLLDAIYRQLWKLLRHLRMEGNVNGRL